MDAGQVIQKTSGACFNSGQHSEDHFVGVLEMIPCSRQLGPGRRNVKCVGLPPVLSRLRRQQCRKR